MITKLAKTCILLDFFLKQVRLFTISPPTSSHAWKSMIAFSKFAHMMFRISRINAHPTRFCNCLKMPQDGGKALFFLMRQAYTKPD